MKHIFLLEDDETLGRGIAMALTGPEVAVLCRHSLAKAREALAEDRFDLLILDVNLPRRQRSGPAASGAGGGGHDSSDSAHRQ